jgi:hypothetical protein
VPAELPVGRELFVHEHRNQAFDEFRPFLRGKYEAYSQWGQDKALPGKESFSTSFQESVRDRSSIKGDPEDCITELAKYQGLGRAYGSFRMMWPGMDLRKVIRNVELFAQKVMPHFK